MNRVFSRKGLAWLVLVAIMVGAGAGIWSYKASFLSKILPGLTHVRKEKPWMTVFVHGTFGSFLGFLSLNDVLSDKISGTLYRKITKLMRDDEYFFVNQPMLKRGLISINPTFDIVKSGGKKYAAYPIIAAYKKFSETVRPEEENYFYTFGWSGLLSQSSRRFEAIRFYNALSQELEKFHTQGIYPRIRIIAHSHGGNLGLNLAAVSKVIQSPAWFKLQKKSESDSDYEHETFTAVFSMMKDLTTRENAKKNIDQKIYDYVPTNKDLRVDELIMLGTPILPETEPLCGSGFFGKVYNFYSDEDMVQRADWVTSKKPFSERRLSQTKFPIITSKVKSRPRVVQGRIMINRGLTDTIKIDHDEKSEDDKKQKEKEDLSIFQRILAGFSSRQTKDPTHKELWCLCWEESEKNTGSFLMPLPVVILTPLLTQVADLRPDMGDIDLHIKEDSDMLSACVTKHDDIRTQVKKCVSYAFLSRLKEEVALWKPDDHSQAAFFNAVYKYLLKAGYPK